MLNADSSALNRERDDQRSATPHDPECRRVVLDLVDKREDALERAAREGPAQLLDQEVRRIRSMHETEQREREKRERHEGQ